MPTPKLSKEKREAIIRLSGIPGYKNVTIASEVGVSTGTVVNVLRTLPPDLLEKDKLVEVDQIEEFSAYHKEKFEHLQERFKKWIGDTESFRAPKKTASKRIKVLGINDLHCPFHDEAALAKAIRDNRDANECWIVGDVLDLFGLSRYPKTRLPYSLVEEFQSGRAVMKTLAETFPVVKVLHGNHDERHQKFFVSRGIPPDVLEYLRFSYPHFDSPLAKLCADFPNVQMMQPKRVDFAHYTFLHQIGDCVLSHAEKYSKIPAKATADVIDWLKRKAEPMGIVGPFKILIQAHTHSAAKIWADYGCVGIEAGCLALTPEYDGSPKLMGRKPVIGYTQIFQEDGVTDVNATNFIQLA